MGALNRSPDGDEQDFSTEKIRHPDYNGDTLANDIALLKLDKPATLNQ